MDNALTLELAVLVANIITDYNIDLTRWIRDEIHERAFYEITSTLFPLLI